jgi:hypothetical protein
MGKILRIVSVAHGIDNGDHARLADDVDLLQSGVPSDEVKLISAEVVAQFLGSLDAERAKIAQMWLDGVRISEIAIRLGRSKRTIERRLEEIRATWNAAGLIDNARL